jgi:transposase
MTPGRNVKRYFAAAMDVSSDRVTWVRSGKKNSRLFIEMLKKVSKVCPDKSLIQVILDNFVIRSSRQTRAWIEEHGQKFRLHFLPPYCPVDNRIERKVWREVHANVTTNHACMTIRRPVRRGDSVPVKTTAACVNHVFQNHGRLVSVAWQLRSARRQQSRTSRNPPLPRRFACGGDFFG